MSYVAMWTAALPAEEARTRLMQILSPHAMTWETDIWLVNLRACRTYWNTCAASVDKPLTAALEAVLRAAGHEGGGVLASAPWHAVLLARSMRNKGLRGLLEHDTPWTRTLLEHMSWEDWWDSVAIAATHWCALRTKKFKEDTFKRQCEQMRRSVQRLGMRRPIDLAAALHGASLERRFGPVLQTLWEWTWSENTAEHRGEFPWREEVFCEAPHVTRHLETPVAVWEHLAAILAEDCGRLCRTRGFTAGTRVTRLDWSLVITDLTRIEVPVVFRHPHSMHAEGPLHATVLRQSEYAFARVVAAWVASESQEALAIVGWTLTASERWQPPPQARDLFGRVTVADADLLPVENLLPVSLERYHLKEDWLPEHAFQLAVAGTPGTSGTSGGHESALLAQARQRPLFYYDTPLAWENQASYPRAFLERTMTKWWEAAAGGERTYYRVIDPRQRSLWIYQDSNAGWYIHGFFA